MFFSSRLVLKRFPDGRLALTFSPALKLVLLVIAAFLLYAAASTSPAGVGLLSRANTIPLLLALLALLGAAYRERWIFDRSAGRLLYQFGLVFLHSNRVIALETIKEVRLARFIKGRLAGKQESGRSFWQRTVLTLSLADREGRLYRLETYQSGNPQQVLQTARELSDYCGLPLLSWESETGD
jgi:hypothetical protein